MGVGVCAGGGVGVCVCLPDILLYDNACVLFPSERHRFARPL